MDNLHIVTVATESKYYFPYLVESCRLNGKELEVIGYGKKWNGFKTKFRWMLEYLEKIDPNDIVCFVDGYDVICTRNLNDLRNAFIQIHKNTSCKIIVGFDNVQWFLNKLIVETYFGTCNNTSLNSGTYIGYAKDLSQILKSIQLSNNNDNADDQMCLTQYCKSNNTIFHIDKDSEIFLTIAHPLHEIDDIVNIDNGTLSYNNNVPFFLHGPGSTFLDNVVIKLGYNYKVRINKIIRHKYGWTHIIVHEYCEVACLVLAICITLLIYFLTKK